jgi:hypothetical protein
MDLQVSQDVYDDENKAIKFENRIEKFISDQSEEVAGQIRDNESEVENIYNIDYGIEE